MTDPTYEAYQDIRRTAHDQFRAAVDTYMADLPDLSCLRWVRHWPGLRAQEPDQALRNRLADAMHQRVHLAAVSHADRTNGVYDDPAVLAQIDLDGLWAQALADITEAEVLDELGDLAEDSPSRERPTEVLGLISAWRAGGPVPRRLVVGASEAAARVGLQPSDVRARLARSHFPEPDDTRPAAYGQTSPCWWADTLDTWWERKPARGPGRSARPGGTPRP
jgi:hypothetical protein